jgi:co-chaperonin GroES (HSP10)
MLLVGNAAWAKEGKNDRAARLLATVPIPGTAANTTAGNMYIFDISWVDQLSRTYYLADRSNAAVDIVDTKTNILMAQLQAGFKGFTGTNGTSGPNGVVTGGHCLFVTDAPSRVVSFDTNFFPPKMVSAVSTASGDLNRADEEAYDPADGVLLAINNADDPPFGTFITVNKSTCALTQPTAPAPGVAAPDRILFNTAGGVNATNGAEQPVWDNATGRFYLSIPQIGTNPSSGGVVRINPTTNKIDKTFPISFCSPAGLAKGPNNDFLVGCNTVFDTAGGLWSQTDAKTAAPIQVILNVKTGNVDQVGGVGVGDEVWFNSGDGNYYTASSTSPLRPLDLSGPADAQGAAILGVIDSRDEEVLQLVPTFNVPAVTGTGAHAASTAHSVAADARNNRIFVPLGANNVFPDCLTGCIAVYWHGDEGEPGRVALP